jgi:hypothetical protein
MFNRATTLTGVSDIDGALQYLEQTALPVVRAQAGYRGTSASVDREAGLLGILTMWVCGARRDASDSAVNKTREEASRLFSGAMTIELFEEVALEVAKPPTAGNSLRVVSYTMDPGMTDEILSYFNSEIVPQAKAMGGFRAVRMMVNRETGAGMVGTVWDDDSAMQQADGQLRSLREEIGRHGVTFGETSHRQIALIDRP